MTQFTPAALTFLRALARHNDRAWFTPRKGTYERELKLPMLALIEEINHGFADFAPDHIRPPHKAMMRIYRDTRFDAARGTAPRPYKTQVAAWWVRRGLEKTSGAGFYFSLSAKEVVIAAGMYMPSPEQLLAVRRHILLHHAELRALLSGRRLKSALTEFEGHRLTRAPRGFPADSPALDLLLCRQWGVSASLPADAALAPSLLKEVTRRFALAAPIVHFLNTPLTAKPRTHHPAEDLLD
jgi:uncharacterized protein (TIGR02453 family)